MTDKLIMTTAQRDNYLQIMRNNMQDPDAYDAITELQSLIMVDSELVGRIITSPANTHKEVEWVNDCMPDTGTTLYASPQSLTPEDDGSDWFYKLQFICRVLQGESPDKTDMQTALGVAQALKRERWTAAKALTSITADDVTDEMLQVFLDALDTPMNYRATVAAAYNTIIKHRGMK